MTNIGNVTTPFIAFYHFGLFLTEISS